MNEKPWWLRFDGAPRWLERTRDGEPPPLGVVEIWVLRAILFLAVVVLIWSFGSGHVTLALVLLLSTAATSLVGGTGMTPSQRTQLLGRKGPDQPG